ncbi:MAG: arsenite efflux transporter metallochaperone ArsD [Verrucomicrobia bacterium]|nr:arsenite efflux transporter metallochaperone ArsD [Verrucomicrobiota bacterium]MDG3939799.1 arsenite efflux transporter metallochaperone ArsD [Pseudomonas aeruginosa]
MNKIEVFDPSLCCSTGVCGVDIDQALVNFAADVNWAKQNGAQIERFNLAQQPQAFADNATVRASLEKNGQDGLPLILVDGQQVLAGRYPGRDELTDWIGANAGSALFTPQTEGGPIMEKKNSEVKSGKKGLWTILKESMNKASSGCGPGCGCHVENQDSKNQRKDVPENPAKDNGKA